MVDPNTKERRVKINDDRTYRYFLYEKCSVGDKVSVYYTNKKPKRTELQNRYLHLYLSLISLSSGNSLKALKSWVKGRFLAEGITEVFGDKVREVRSTTELNKSEFEELINRIEKVTGIPAPPTELFKLPHSHEEHRQMKEEQKRTYQGYKFPKRLKINQ